MVTLFYVILVWLAMYSVKNALSGIPELRDALFVMRQVDKEEDTLQVLKNELSLKQREIISINKGIDRFTVFVCAIGMFSFNWPIFVLVLLINIQSLYTIVQSMYRLVFFTRGMLFLFCVINHAHLRIDVWQQFKQLFI